jgi:integrase/recombinase XerD
MPQAQVLSDAEFKRALALARSRPHAERNVLALLLSYFAGMRVKEIAALKVGDVYEKNGVVRGQVRLTADQTKGNAGRIVYFNQKVRRALEQYRRFAAFVEADQANPLLASQKGGFFSGNSLCQVFLRLFDAADMQFASSHSGRRSFITALAKKGVGAKVLMALAGHRHLSTTQRYIDINEQMLSDAVNLL